MCQKYISPQFFCSVGRTRGKCKEGKPLSCAAVARYGCFVCGYEVCAGCHKKKGKSGGRRRRKSVVDAWY